MTGDSKKKVLLCYLRTGRGHYAPARAIEACLREMYHDSIEPILVDGLHGTPAITRHILEDGYRLAQAHAPWVYEGLYGLTKFLPLARANSSLVSRFIRPFMERKILDLSPDLIVIFHFFLIVPILDILHDCRLDIPILTIVTDPYTAHPLWFLRKDQTMILFSDELKGTARRYGFSDQQIHRFPIVLDERVCKPLSPNAGLAERTRLGFRPGQKIILILGGGDGMPRGMIIARTITRALPDAGVVLVCGQNAALFHAASKFLKTKDGAGLRVLGYVNNVPNLIEAADVVVTKGGASTLMETLAMGKTPIVTQYIWEQEKGNVEFLVRAGRGMYQPAVKKLPGILREVFAGTPPFDAILQKNRSYIPAIGTRAVSEFIRRSVQPIEHVIRLPHVAPCASGSAAASSSLTHS